MPFLLFEKLVSKLISAIAALFIVLGVVEMPKIPDYQPAEKIFIQKIIAETPIEKPAEQPLINPPKIASPEKSALTQTKEKPPPAPAQISLTELNEKARSAIINIICSPKTGSLQSITGSGVIINGKGVILTTAHIGEYFLLENEASTGYLNCIIRNRDIAENAYDAKLIYIPSSWIEKNSDAIIRQEPKGTGEDDFSFLLIDSSLRSDKKLPAEFIHSEPNFNFEDLPINLSVLLASYPAGLLGGVNIQKNLGLASAFTQIKTFYTFSETEQKTLDLFSIAGNILAQSGSSGGGVFDTRDGKLLGVIVTSTEGTTTASKILNAVTLPYIKRSLEKYTGKNLEEFLTNPESFPNIFSENEFTRLKNLLVSELKKR